MGLGATAANTASSPTNLSVGFSLAGVTGAAKIRLTATLPNGTTAAATCTDSPCAVSVDARQGSAVVIRVEYLSSGDAVLASGDLQRVAI